MDSNHQSVLQHVRSPAGRRRLDLLLLSATLLLAQPFAAVALASEGFSGVHLADRRRLSVVSHHDYSTSSSRRRTAFLGGTTTTTPGATRHNPLLSLLIPSTTTTTTTTSLNQSYRSGGDGRKNGTTDESWWSPTEERSSPFKVRRRVGSALRQVRNKTSSSSSSSRLYQAADDDRKSPNQTWSRPGEVSSSLGVRKRVKAVLKKARSRTGVTNASEDPQVAGLWIAEAASIGGLAEKSDLIIKKTTSNNRQNGVKVNGASNGASSSSSSSNGQSSLSAIDFDVQRDEIDTDDETYSNRDAQSKDRSSSSSPEIDGIRADVPTPPPEPLPFTLPVLSDEQKQVLLSGERVQEQSKMGREGSGYVVMDVKAPPHVIWECLLDFEAYPELIKTVRAMEMFTSNKLTSGYHSEKPVPKGSNRETRHYGIPSVTRAAFVLSKFKLNIAAIHNYRPHPDGHYMVFNLDPECTNIVLQSATGIWYTQANPEGRGEDYTRVWLLCELKVSPILPKFIVDYTAKRAMPRATNWLKPHVEPLAEKWAQEQHMES